LRSSLAHVIFLAHIAPLARVGHIQGQEQGERTLMMRQIICVKLGFAANQGSWPLVLLNGNSELSRNQTKQKAEIFEFHFRFLFALFCFQFELVQVKDNTSFLR